jgi:hypothetical protein
MANRFVRAIRQVRDIKRVPLFTNEENDLISDTKNNVYVRVGRDYKKITGIEDIERRLKKLEGK